MKAKKTTYEYLLFLTDDFFANLVYYWENLDEDKKHIVELNNLNQHEHQLNVNKLSNHVYVVDYELLLVLLESLMYVQLQNQFQQSNFTKVWLDLSNKLLTNLIIIFMIGHIFISFLGFTDLKIS